MTSSMVPVLEALYARLGALGYTIYNHVPQGTAFPYIVIGNATVIDDGTKTAFGESHSVLIQIYSRHRGEKEALDIASNVYDLLHEKLLALTGHDNWRCRCEFGETLPEPDGLSVRVLRRYRIDTSQ